MARILLADDEIHLRRVLGTLLRGSGHEVVEAANAAAARHQLAGGVFDLLITDQKMPDGDGLGLLAAAREADPTLPVVLLTAFATVELAVEAMRRGAFDFIAKPFAPGTVEAVVRRALEHAELRRENAALRESVRRPEFGELVGDSRPMRQLRDLIARVGPTRATVLITGETGTGKELVARALHEASPRSARPFLAVNCAAFTETLLESELFGHERGAFTGADRARQGLFEAAHRGTLFLDEAGEMPAALQAKLLRVLMNGEVVRVGSTAPRVVDVRLLVATHRDLAQAVREGHFREDLYYRLAVVPMHVPALRERREDLPALAERLSRQVAHDLKLPPRRLDAGALAALAGYAFPGNVRELRNLIERATILTRGDSIGPADLPVLPALPGRAVPGPEPRERWLASLPEHLDLRATLREVERALVERALVAAGGVQAEAARRLALTRSDMTYKLRRLHLEARGARDPGGDTAAAQVAQDDGKP